MRDAHVPRWILAVVPYAQWRIFPLHQCILDTCVDVVSIG